MCRSLSIQTTTQSPSPSTTWFDPSDTHKTLYRATSRRPAAFRLATHNTHSVDSLTVLLFICFTAVFRLACQSVSSYRCILMIQTESIFHPFCHAPERCATCRQMSDAYTDGQLMRSGLSGERYINAPGQPTGLKSNRALGQVLDSTRTFYPPITLSQ
jgi:hypothetical protein